MSLPVKPSTCSANPVCTLADKLFPGKTDWLLSKVYKLNRISNGITNHTHWTHHTCIEVLLLRTWSVFCWFHKHTYTPQACFRLVKMKGLGLLPVVLQLTGCIRYKLLDFFTQLTGQSQRVLSFSISQTIVRLLDFQLKKCSLPRNNSSSFQSVMRVYRWAPEMLPRLQFEHLSGTSVCLRWNGVVANQL